MLLTIISNTTLSHSHQHYLLSYLCLPQPPQPPCHRLYLDGNLEILEIPLVALLTMQLDANQDVKDIAEVVDYHGTGGLSVSVVARGAESPATPAWPQQDRKSVSTLSFSSRTE